MNLAKAAIGAGGGIIQGALGMIGAARERKFQREMTQNQYSHDIQMWNKQNEYNSPANQKQRMKEAGLNPALMYGNAPQNVSTTLPKHGSSETPTYTFDPAQILNMMSQFLTLRGQEEENKSKEIDNKYRDEHLNFRNNLQWTDLNKANLLQTGGNNSPMMRKFNADIKSVEQSNMLKELDRKLWSKGISRTDSAFVRILIQNGQWDRVAQYLKKIFK